MDKSFDKSLLGLNIKHLRTSSGLTQTALSKILGVNSTTLSNWEVGISSPDMGVLAKISKHFGVSLDFLAFIEYSKWSSDRGTIIINDDMPGGPCKQCELREEIIKEKNEVIGLLKDKIRTLNDPMKGTDQDIRQTG